MKSALFLFDYSLVMASFWARAGVECYCVDIQHEPRTIDYRGGGKIYAINEDVKTWHVPARLRQTAVFAFGFPPCTDVAVSGARWMQDKGLGAIIHALQLFKASVDIATDLNVPYGLENPVSTVSTYWRKPDYTFNPYEYAGYGDVDADRYTKKTCLWTGNGFVMPGKKPLMPLSEKNWTLQFPPSPDRANARSKTPVSFARAVFEANYKG